VGPRRRRASNDSRAIHGWRTVVGADYKQIDPDQLSGGDHMSNRSSHGRERSRLAVLTIAILIAASGCGSDDNSGGSAGSTGPDKATVDQALADKVPAAIKSDGKIVIGTDPTYAPSEFLEADGKTVTGFDVEVFNAVAAKLGLRTEYVSSKFGDIIAGVQSGKYEVGVSSFTINDERKAQSLMVSYFSAGTQWAAKKGNPAKIDPDNACGKKIAVQRDTVQVDDITARSQKCKTDSKPEIGIDQYQGQDQATASVVSGKDDAMLADSPVCAYAVKQTNGQLELLGSVYDSAPYGYVVKEDQRPFAEALLGALTALIADGSYRKVLDKWGLADGAITSPAINP
jgi:polar amino acid transport system substrate-binding protein